jgi:hypothetical protein
LHQYDLTYVAVCGYVKELPGRAIADVEPVDIDRVLVLDGHDHRVGLLIGPAEDGRLHVHFNIARLEELDESDMPEKCGDIDDMPGAIESLYGCSIQLLAYGSYRAEWDRVSQSGLIHGLSGVSSEAGDLTLSLTGSEISIKGSSGCTKFTWSKVKDRVRGTIVARIEVPISERYLEDAANLLDAGVRRFVLEEIDSP